MARFDWVDDFVGAVTTPPPDTAPQLQPLGTTREQLMGQIADAYAIPGTAVVKAYIAEAKRRLANT